MELNIKRIKLKVVAFGEPEMKGRENLLKTTVFLNSSAYLVFINMCVHNFKLKISF